MVQSASGGGRDPHDGEADYRDIKRRLDTLGDALKQTKKSGDAGGGGDGEARGKADRKSVV